MRIFILAIAVVNAMPAFAQTTAPVEHRLSADEIAAAQADGAERNRAAELLAMTRGDAGLALPGERPKKIHGEAGFGIDSNGGRAVFGEVTTAIGENATATVAGSYKQFGRTRYRNR